MLDLMILQYNGVDSLYTACVIQLLQFESNYKSLHLKNIKL